MTSVSVALGDRSYQIHIGDGLLAKSGELLAPHIGRARKMSVVTDETVARLHYPALAESLQASGHMPLPIVLPPGEQTKCFQHLERLTGALLDQGVERGALIVALGGGVIG